MSGCTGRTRVVHDNRSPCPVHTMYCVLCCKQSHAVYNHVLLKALARYSVYDVLAAFHAWMLATSCPLNTCMYKHRHRYNNHNTLMITTSSNERHLLTSLANVSMWCKFSQVAGIKIVLSWGDTCNWFNTMCACAVSEARPLPGMLRYAAEGEY